MTRIDRISARAKSVDRFVTKAAKLDPQSGQAKYADPLNQIQDQIGARVVTYYLSDVEAVAREVARYYGKIEQRRIVPDSPSEFGYEGEHFILLIPDELVDDAWKEMAPEFFELQVKTLFQHAWGEANHDLGYKPSRPLTHNQKRTIAFTSAQAWGADEMFNRLHAELVAETRSA